MHTRRPVSLYRAQEVFTMELQLYLWVPVSLFSGYLPLFSLSYYAFIETPFILRHSVENNGIGAPIGERGRTLSSILSKFVWAQGNTNKY